jgi:hypothetical protein
MAAHGLHGLESQPHVCMLHAHVQYTQTDCDIMLRQNTQSMHNFTHAHMCMNICSARALFCAPAHATVTMLRACLGLRCPVHGHYTDSLSLRWAVGENVCTLKHHLLCMHVGTKCEWFSDTRTLHGGPWAAWARVAAACVHVACTCAVHTD